MKQAFRWSCMSATRKRYFLRLGGRILVLIGCVLLLILRPETFGVLNDGGFFGGLTVLHALWVIWMIDMALQLLPIHKRLPLGSAKVFRQNFRPLREGIQPESLKRYIRTVSRSALYVMLLWAALIAVLGVLHGSQILRDEHLFLISVLFYVCDLICVLIWCPFRLMMRNRCCTTCRIFNWDHLMMFSPLIFVRGFYTWSLVIVAVLVVMCWEGCVILFPERFWEHTNGSLQCSQCTDKLCTQYCQKLRG